MSNFDLQTKCFLEFLKSKAVIISEKIKIHDFRDKKQGRGMIAIADIDEGETLFTIPSNALLRVEDDPVLLRLVEKYGLDAWSGLIVKMMHCFESKEWKPYFDILPHDFNTPMFWDNDDLKLLKGSAILDKIDKEGADSLFDDLKNGILTEDYFNNTVKTLENFHRMGSLIMAYGFDVPGDNDEEEGKAMVVLADILNSHTVMHNARLTIPENEGEPFEMVASKPIAKGEQVYNNYGDLASCDMLRRYGYVEAGGTEFEVVEIGLSCVMSVISKYIQKDVEEVEHILEARVGKYIDIPESFVLGTVKEETDDVTSLEIDLDLLLILNCMVYEGDFTRKEFRKLASLSECEELSPNAAILFQEIIEKRKLDYPKLIKPSEPDETMVYVDKQDMSAQVLQCEMKILDMARDWCKGNKRQKTN